MRWVPEGKYFYFMVSEGITAQALAENIRSQPVTLPAPADEVPASPTSSTKPTLPLTDAQRRILERFEQMLMLKHYSPRTIGSYKSTFVPFLRHCGPTHPLDLQHQDVLDYMADLIQQRSLSGSHQNIIINAIKFYYEQVDWQPESAHALHVPRNPRSCPRSWTRRRSNA